MGGAAGGPRRIAHPDRLEEVPTNQARENQMPSEPKSLKQTLVEEGTEFKGTLKSSCPVVVNGTVDGEVDVPELTITVSGTVVGVIKAKQLRSRGTLAGHIDAVDVSLFGKVRSNTVVRASSLEMKIGSPERGNLEVTFGERSLRGGTDSEGLERPTAPNGAADIALADGSNSSVISEGSSAVYSSSDAGAGTNTEGSSEPEGSHASEDVAGALADLDGNDTPEGNGAQGESVTSEEGSSDSDAAADPTAGAGAEDSMNSGNGTLTSRTASGRSSKASRRNDPGTTDRSKTAR
jgi:cytoskeletal protein CcmA (bactofilin family)